MSDGTRSHVAAYKHKNLSDSNTVGSFTMANSNSLLSPQEVLLIAQESKYLWLF